MQIYMLFIVKTLGINFCKCQWVRRYCLPLEAYDFLLKTQRFATGKSLCKGIPISVSTYGSAYDERCVLEHSIRSEYEDKTSETLPISVTTWRPDSPHDSRYRVKTSHDLEKKISTPCYAPGLLNKTLVPTNLRDLDNIGLTDVIP
ncbi:unnamed protein product [Fusarium graminearum]|nr:unnamed protein product [Fusarium graminearum]